MKTLSDPSPVSITYTPEVASALLHKPEAAAALLGIGRTKLFELIATGQLETVTIGRSRRVPHQSLVALVERLRERAGAAA